VGNRSDVLEGKQENDIFHDPLRDMYSRMTYRPTTEETKEITMDEEDWEREETFLERVVALKEMIPESARNLLSLSFRTTCRWILKTTKYTGHWAWITSTSLLLVGLPLVLEMEKEQVFFEFEASQFQQQTAQQILQGTHV
jgi:import receptor subunit TOM22